MILNKRVLALDVGDVRIGVAISDATGTIAMPLDTITRVGYRPDCAKVVALCTQYETNDVVLGLPLNMDGTEGIQAQKVRSFSDILSNAGLNIYFQDERMTTVSAENVLISGNVQRKERKQNVDKLAATIILEQWLATTKNKEDVHMENLENDFIYLQDEEGNEIAFVHISTVEHQQEYYIALAEAKEDDNDDSEEEITILKIVVDENGEDTYVSIDDEEELQIVFEKFLSEYEKQFDEDEDEDYEFGEYDEKE